MDRPGESRGAGRRPVDRYYYRRELTVRELLPAVGLAVGAGLAAFYLARILLQRTPLAPRRSASARARG
jgi:hypothetical protein